MSCLLTINGQANGTAFATSTVERIQSDLLHVSSHDPATLLITTTPILCINAPSAAGAISVEQLVLRYRPGLPRVLRGVSFEVAGGNKVGLVGRTGSGKSSLLLALFRCVARSQHSAGLLCCKSACGAGNYAGVNVLALPLTTRWHSRCCWWWCIIVCRMVEPESGRIVVDGVDISTLGLRHLRSQMSIIPQEPFLFSGTVRSNLDPFNAYQEADLWRAVNSVGLKEAITALDCGLDAHVVDGGNNFSQVRWQGPLQL